MPRLMTDLEKNLNIRITRRERAEIEKFADARCAEDQSLYKARGNFKRSDIVVGAMAEMAAYKVLKRQGVKVNRPDFKIYDKKDKSFESDLTDGTKHFHVKGQSMESAKRYGHSWLMQRSDKLTKVPKYNHYLVPTMVSEKDNIVFIFGFPSFTALHHVHAFSDCKLEHINRTKTAIYLESLFMLSDVAMFGGLRNFKW